MRLRINTSLAAVAAVALFVAGCESSGLSVREQPGCDYSGDLAALTAGSTPSAPARPVVLPVKVAVAQVGELAPPQKMLDLLRKSDAFALVSPAPCVRQNASELRRYAQEIGADYLFIFGGSVDRSDGDTSLSVANLTIVGAFIIPSKQLDAEGKAAGALIDLGTNRIVASVNADAQKHELVPAASTDVSQTHMLEAMRDELTADLAQRLIAQLKTVASARPTS